MKYHVIYHPLWDLLYAMADLAVADEEKKKIDEVSEKLKKPEMRDLLNGIMQETTDYMKSELKYFFAGGNNFCDGIGQLIMHTMMKKHPELNRPEDLIDQIREEDKNCLAQAVTSSAYYEVKNECIEDLDCWEAVKEDPEAMHHIIKGLKFENPGRKEKILQCIKNTEEIKLRLSMLLEVFYGRSLRKTFESLPDRMEPYVQQYQREIDENPDAFFRKYFSSEAPKEEDEWIVVSYFRMIKGDFWTGKKRGAEWHILGCYAKEYEETFVDRDRIFGFLKAVGEKNRLQIIELLREKPYYVNEIAEKMKMTAPTVSYHLTTLQNFGIVDYERYEHRFYYFLNLNKLEEWLDKVKDYYHSDKDR